MKTQFIKFLISLFLVTLYNKSSAQSLFINGRVYNDSGQAVVAKYALVCNNKVIKTGKRRKVKIKLDLNKEYTLIVSKENFTTRAIKISTNAQTDDDFIFAFDIILTKKVAPKDLVSITEPPKIIVYYDTAMDVFNYSYMNKTQLY